ncbi:diadenylate cyclase CdaA [Microaerobacter geothermalis]|uniref:diadenylate cyclase CdaA n=1 Tax=Microaerobacter geothermalis TaxID=674972 RepID=UPI001F353565|nr:diadenylate cyclase CdaA [Microaerobacter geothermalis]MCF6093870.1 diadenylate cyclase CdaA [Microaerobacter geothermalis]
MDSLRNVVQYLGDVVDILIVTYIIYKFILFIRGTRAIQLLKGITVIVIVWLLSIYFQLNTLQWLMSQAFTYGVFAILIIFQPELRRALERLGRNRIFSLSSHQEDDEVEDIVHEIVKAVQYMEKRRIGALIVIERDTGINDYIETGIEINGKVSSELLINIFIPNTPLHDGAVILRKDAVMAASCYLPLSENPFINKELGTRHRAGIGITEVSDSLSVIVSEETGQVSIAKNGEMERNISDTQLEEWLVKELKPAVKPSNGPWYRKGSRHG